jgi:hypothetical protein
MFVEYNGVSLIGGNCKKSLMHIILISPNGKILYFNFVILSVLSQTKCNLPWLFRQ